MGESTEKPSSFDPAIQTEKLGFDPGELVKCDECSRTNPPNRLTCLYCGNTLTIDPRSVPHLSPVATPLDLWERGFNLVVAEPVSIPDSDLIKASQVLALEEDVLRSIIAASIPLPLARVENERSAEDLKAILQKLGVSTLVIRDEQLDPDRPPKRLRRIDFEPDALLLTLFNADEVVRVPRDDLILLIEGVISLSRADQVEKRGLRGGRKVIDETSSILNEPVIDIYTKGDTRGYRMQTTGFDFSGLGEAMSIVAGDNLGLLIDRILEYSPKLKRVRDYPSLRPVLGDVWEVELRQESTGLRRPGLGRKGFGSLTSSTNQMQFTKFSRLQRILYETQRI